jgi:hypothetical protein
MAAPVTPAKKLANGKDTWWLVPAGTNINAPTVAEVNHATGLNISGMLLQDYEGLSVSTDRVTLPQVMLETVTTEISGQTTITAADMQITFQPQAVGGSEGKEAYELVKNGFTGYLVRRQDVLSTSSDAVVAAQFVDVLGMDVTTAIPGKTSAGPDGIYIATVPVSITSDDWNVAVAA